MKYKCLNCNWTGNELKSTTTGMLDCCPNCEEITLDECIRGIENVSMCVEPCIMFSNWCIGCYPKKIYASFIYDGKSLCDVCFKIIFKNEKEK